MEISGFEPEASHMRSERSTTELYPRLKLKAPLVLISMITDTFYCHLE